MSIQEQCDFRNEMIGDRNKYDGIECSKCLNRGFIHVVNAYDEIVHEDCICKSQRKIALTIKKSGLEDNFKRYTMDNYNITQPFQQDIKTKALKFIKEHSKKNALGNVIEQWFYISGQVGSGKSHICTAIASELIKQGYDFKYLDFAHEMSRLTTELRSGYPDVREKTEKEFDYLCNVKVLYIDDFMKTSDDKHLFDLINSRYGKNNLITIISSEKVFDKHEIGYEGLPSRIYERCGQEYYITLGKDINKNYRLGDK